MTDPGKKTPPHGKDEPGETAKSEEPSAKKAEKKPSGRIEIPLISTPNDQIEMERELEELFNEEKVKHKHGGTEPERD
jgi:anti-sigma28 factor (negative regulator of flagellin synthesis)